MSRGSIIPATTLPLFEALEPHLVAGHDLIPLKRLDKVPLHAGWPIETPLTYDEAHAHMANGGNIGVRLRPDMLVIDVDPRHAPPGSKPIEELQNKLGISLTSGPLVLTGGGGQHFYFKKPVDRAIRTKLSDFPAIEFKSAGAQVVASGSVHPTGVHYRCEILQDDFASTPDAPDALLDLIARPSGGNNPASGQLSPEALEACLAGLDVRQYRDQDRWQSLMMSCHYATAGAGREEFVGWSISDPEFSDDEEIIKLRWDSLGFSKEKPITTGTLFYELKSVGREDLVAVAMRIPPEEDFDDDVAENFVAPFNPGGLSESKSPNGFRSCLKALAGCNLQFGFDELSQRAVVRAERLPWSVDAGREVNDDFVRIVRFYLLEQFQRDFSKENVFEACMTLAATSPFNPVNEYLDELEWDGTKRLDTWLIDYLGAENVPLNREIGRLVMIAAVRRARKPGTKFDQVLILEGKQGTGKSSALQILGGEWHSDADLGPVESKEASIGLQGCWIFELGEMTAMGRSEIEALKAFLSRNADRYRAPYERALKSVPRRCVFIGTTNADGYLRDATGNRRFWPVRTGEIDLEKLKANRDQLWAEAAAAEASGESLELRPALREVASEAQQSRLIDDPWKDTLADFLQGSGETRVHTTTLLPELWAAESASGQAPSRGHGLTRLGV